MREGLSHPKTCGTPKLSSPKLLWFTGAWAGPGREGPVPPPAEDAPLPRRCSPWNQSQRRQIALSVPMIFNSVFPRAIRSIFSWSRWSFPILLSAVPAPRAVTSHHAFSQAICTSSFFCCRQFSGGVSPLLCSHRSFCGDETQPAEPRQKQMQKSPAAPAHLLFMQMGGWLLNFFLESQFLKKNPFFLERLLENRGKCGFLGEIQWLLRKY